MEASYYQSPQVSYQNHPRSPREHRNDIPPSFERTNNAGHTDVLSRHRPRYSGSHSPASGRSIRNREFQAARARSRLQTRASPSAPRVASSSPERRNASYSMSTLSSFPMPYRSQPATHHLSSPNEYTSTSSPLTSQEFHSYHPSPIQNLLRRLPSPSDTTHALTSTTSLSDSNISDSNLDFGYVSPQGWQTRDPKWPQSRTQSRKKYVPKGRRYDSPSNQRRMGPRDGFFQPPKRHASLMSTEVANPKSRNGRKKRTLGPSSDGDMQQASDQPPRLAACPLPSSLLDGVEDISMSTSQNTTSVSQYISGDADDSIRPIRESIYWEQIQDDPIFRDLSKDSELVSIKDLVKRRDLMLKDHVSRPAIMKEQGTQTDPENSPGFRSSFPLNSPPTDQAGEFGQLQREQNSPQQSVNLRPTSNPTTSRKKPHIKEKGHYHYRTTSLTDAENTQIRTEQPTRMRGIKRSRSPTEDDYSSDHVQSKKMEIEKRSSSPNGFRQRSQTPFYSRKR